MSGSFGAAGAAHAHAQPPEVAGAQRLLQAAQTVVAAQALALLQADLTEGQFDLVMDHEHPLHRDLVPAGGLGRRAAGEVHEGHGQQEHHPPAGDPALGGEALEPGAQRGQAVTAAQFLAHHEADVVAMELVFRPGIAQGDEQVDGAASTYAAAASTAPELLLALDAADDLGLGGRLDDDRQPARPAAAPARPP